MQSSSAVQNYMSPLVERFRHVARQATTPTPPVEYRASEEERHAAWKRLVGRWGATLFITCGLITAASVLLPVDQTTNRAGVVIVGLIAMLVGIVDWNLPWYRWRLADQLWLVLIAFGLIAAHNHFGGAEPYRYGLFFIVVYAWIGVGHPRWTGVRYTPFVTAAYLLPLWTSGHYSAAAASSVVFTVPICLLVGETLAWVSERLRQTEFALHQEARFRSLVSNSSDLIALIDASDNVLYVSPAVEWILGYRPEELINSSVFERIHPDDIDHLTSVLNGQTSDVGIAPPVEIRYQHADGRWHYIEAMVNNRLNDPAVGGIIVTVRDVSDRKHAEEALQSTESKYRTLVEQIPAVTYADAIDTLSSSFYVSPQIEKLMGYTVDEWLDDPQLWLDSLHHEDRDRVVAEHTRTNNTGDPFSIEYRLITRDRRQIWVRDDAILVRDDAGIPRFWQGILLDISERKELEAQLQYQAFHDSLTDLPNRALFLDRLDHALARAADQDETVAVIFLDVDNFKVINDSLGHEIGDRFLAMMAVRLRDCLRRADTVARLGGDEFTVLLEDLRGPHEAVEAAQRIAAALKSPFKLEGQELFISASMGIALNGSEHDSTQNLLRTADIALYRAKGSGKACYQLFEPGMNTETLARLEMERDLHHALDRSEFKLYYQPIVDLASGQVTEMEALIRWQHPTRGLVPPLEFIPLAEELGLIVPIGRWVLQEACKQARKWHIDQPGEPALAVSVNVSARQFRDSNLVSDIRDALIHNSLDPHRLRLEVTETFMMQDAESARDALKQLQALGVQIAIDDFGVGYSSLSFLKQFPVNILKIDRSFIRGLTESPGDLALVRAMIAVARTLGLTVTAEGIETAEQLAELCALGCDRGQGFYLAKPALSKSFEVRSRTLPLSDSNEQMDSLSLSLSGEDF